MARQHNRVDVRLHDCVSLDPHPHHSTKKEDIFFQFSEYLLVSAKAAKCVCVCVLSFFHVKSIWTRARYGNNERRRIEFISCISLI